MSIRDIEKELGLDEALAIEGSTIAIRIEKRRYGKSVTVLSGFDPAVDVDGLAKDLKHFLGTGGTVRDREVELQGDHKNKARAWLEKAGYAITV